MTKIINRYRECGKKKVIPSCHYVITRKENCRVDSLAQRIKKNKKDIDMYFSPQRVSRRKGMRSRECFRDKRKGEENKENEGRHEELNIYFV